MIIRTMELLFEYMALMLCIHKVAKQKIKLNIWMMIPFFIEWIYVFCTNAAIIPMWCRLFIFAGIFLYTRIRIADSWRQTVNIFGIMLIVIIFMQIPQYYLLNSLPRRIFVTKYSEIIANINICILIFLWKEKYWNIIIARLSKMKNILIFSSLLIILLHLLVQNAFVDFGLAIRFLIETAGLCLVCVLWISAEKEKRHKLRELQMYEMYNQAFEEAIVTIRTRQHEFENHINAIKCMQYTIDNHEKLLLAQEQYCEKVLQENKLNKMLKLNIEPVLIGFLYSKITAAEEKSIVTECEIQIVDIKRKIAVYEFIELVGILFDNAVEALEKSPYKRIVLKLLEEGEGAFSIEIANASPLYTNSEIEKFCSYGYSTKGRNRGIGLSRAKEISKKYCAIYQIQNCIYDGEIYLSFKLKFT